ETDHGTGFSLQRAKIDMLISVNARGHKHGESEAPMLNKSRSEVKRRSWGPKRRLVHSELSLRQIFKSRAFRDRGTRFLIAPHLIENVREKDVLPRLVWLTGNRAALRAAGVFEAILPHPYLRYQVKRIGFMHVEPARVT